MSSTILYIDGLVKRFSGLLATDHVTLDLREGLIHALIGPNGAGKSTLINQLCGELSPDAGKITLEGRDITNVAAADRVALGLGRTFQVTSLLDDFTVRQNVGLAVQAHMGGNFRIWDRISGRTRVWDRADALLQGSRLATRRDDPVADLSHGERKQLELLLALAGDPKVLLLDEPMAGLGPVESREMVDFLLGLRGKVTILLVEHDMEAVFALADRISVLVYGKVILTGTADQIRESAEVREAYLGGEDELC
ncbi:ABC transporter ATP-binding protein [Pseudooceanicola algae]|uniref:Lipopolysaccharide export system ATP-binding protein LptB n=1 Tax=Pseudooceanicola algae TaxID=1537215 RepID=A0A418SHR3_9RHOB|nr:ABC transporter ATP-binding protein [Pseudooceanicola algae]QPM90262.1 Lipopolysaccharide export system ATP-binding protein LptB [Pseudooceanicola algae]